MLDSHHHIRFSLIMRGLYVLMRFTAFHSPAFKEKIKDKNLALTMTSQAVDRSRTFRFFSGKVRYIVGQTPDSTVRLIWASPEKGERIMLKMAMGHPRALMEAVISRDLQLEGDAAGIKWFLDIINHLSRTYRIKKRKAV